jgi:hypothetical protein
MANIAGFGGGNFNPNPPNARDTLRSSIAEAGRSRQSLVGLRDASHVAASTQVDRERRRGLGSLSSQVAQHANQQPAATFGGALDDALKRTKVRSRIASQGDKAIEQQGLRDRVAIAMQGRQREGAFMNAAASAANIREGVNVGVANANAFADDAKAGAFGTVAGAIGGVLANKEGRAGLKNIFSKVFGSRSTSVLPGPAPLPPAIPDGS